VEVGSYYGKEDVIKLLDQIGRNVRRRVRAYLLGGTVLTYLGLKDSTKDVDLVVENFQAYSEVVKALRKLKFVRKTKMKFVDLEGRIVDIDYGKFVKLKLYEVMKKRSRLIGVFGNLEAYMLIPEHIVFYKAITPRERDIDDIVLILKNIPVNWNILVRDAEEITRKELAENPNPIILTYELYVTFKRIRSMCPELIPLDIFSKIKRIGEKQFYYWLKRKEKQ